MSKIIKHNSSGSSALDKLLVFSAAQTIQSYSSKDQVCTTCKRSSHYCCALGTYNPNITY
eukprot:6465703-Amphidinium_carterae.1